MICFFDRYGKGNQCRRYADIVKCSGHGIFSADRRRFKSQFRFNETKQRLHRFSPFFRMIAQTFKILLIRQPGFGMITTHCRQASQCFYNGIRSSQIRRIYTDTRMIAMRHDGTCIRIAKYRQFLYGPFTFR